MTTDIEQEQDERQSDHAGEDDTITHSDLLNRMDTMHSDSLNRMDAMHSDSLNRMDAIHSDSLNRTDTMYLNLLNRMDESTRELRTEMRWLFGIGVALIGLFIVVATFVR